MFYRFRGLTPVCHPDAFVHPQATVVGDVVVGDLCYVGPGAVVRGDWGRIVLERGVNVQEGCCVHMFPGIEVRLRENAHIGHGAVIHGAELGADCLVGMNAVVMDGALVGAGSIVGALAFVKAGMQIPPRSLVVGNPARVVGEVDDRRAVWKRAGTELYHTLPRIWREEVEMCEPLAAEEPDRARLPEGYAPLRGDA